jgi:hypothetical protein
MKTYISATLLLTALLLSACDKNSSVTNPDSATGTSDVFSTATVQSLAQEGELTDMLILGEDPSSLLGTTAGTHLTGFILGASPSIYKHGNRDARKYYDVAALMYLRAAIKANSDLTGEQIAAIKAAIDSSNTIRYGLAADTTMTSADRAPLLKAEHERLMLIIAGDASQAGILTAEQAAKTVALLAEIETARAAKHAEMLEKRIAAVIARWDETLTLTDDQKTQIAELLRLQDSDIQAARAQYEYDPEGFRAAALAIQTTTQNAIRALLTDVQQPLWDELVAEGWHCWAGGGPFEHHGEHHGGRHG